MLTKAKLVEAEQMYRRVLTGYEKALGPDHISTLNNLYRLCAILLSYAWKVTFQSTEIEYSLPQKIHHLSELAYIYGGRVLTIYDALRRALLWGSDEGNARIAFRQLMEVQGDVSVYAGIQCDGCLSHCTRDDIIALLSLLGMKGSRWMTLW